MDKLLEMAFADHERWQKAVEKGLGKGVCKKDIKELCDERVRVSMYLAIKNGKYRIAPPHIALIPKDDGTYRTVYVNEPKDRVLLSLINDLLFDTCGQVMVHKACKSYQKGISCGKVVQEISEQIVATSGNKNGVVGWKADLSKYFDSVPIYVIDTIFDRIEEAHGKSALIDVLRAYYHSDWYFDENNDLQQKYQSLKQGCAVAAFLADVALYHIDQVLSKLNGVYVRYSDDILFVGQDYEKAMSKLKVFLEQMQMTLNPRKVEHIDNKHWVKFLGFSIRGNDISLSNNGIKKFQKAIEDATIKKKSCTYDSALHGVYRALYKGYNDFSWATRVLRVINVVEDIDTLNGFAMDCIRASQTGKKKVGGLGFVKDKKVGCIDRGKGKNVKANKEKMPELKGYYTIRCMQNNLRTSKGAFNAIIRIEM